MACGGSSDSSCLEDCLETNQDKANFIRLTRLLICGGTVVIRELFDSMIPPTNLANALMTSKTKLQPLRTKRILTQPQWDLLYPPSGTVADSKSFDITLLFKLLREICGLTAPATGWDNLPNITDITLEADLARIKYYRNEIYGHVTRMELSDGDFQNYWQEIKSALLRIVGSYDSSTVTDCENKINDYLIAPISDEDKRNVEELRWWYFQDVELKDIITCMKDKLDVLAERGQQRQADYPDIIVKCAIKLASAGAWILGSAVIFNQYMDDPETLRTLVQEVVFPMGLVVVAILKGSIDVLLWATEQDALNEFWKRYQTGQLREDLEKVLITEELRQLANGDAVELEVTVSEEEYQRAHEYLTGEDKEGNVQKDFSPSYESEEEVEYVMLSSASKEARVINGLVTVDLTNYVVVSYFPDFTAINNLQVIRMPTHFLKDIPYENCKIPNSFCNMKYLKKLCLFGDNLSDESGLTCLPKDFSKLKSLEELNLQHNSFSVFPQQICMLENLKKLYLNGCGLTSISTDISRLVNLVEADLSQNDFSGGLSKELFNLPKLKDLYLIECNLDHLPPEIGNLKQLEGIRLNDNKLEELPDELFTLKHLKKLSVVNNRISKLSPKIINLTNLRVLLLKGNNLKVLPEEISKLLNLQVVNVFDNKLSCLPDTITEMDSSLQFVIHGNEYLQRPPLSICTNGIDSIKGYFESLKKDRPVHSNRIKIVMLGEIGAGKTCLAKALVNCYATDHSEDVSTIGVQMHHWQIEPDGLEACIFDLAGQRRYQLTHPFFLSEGALHILVVNLKTYQCSKESFKENVEDWIEWVTARLWHPRIMIVPTHKDECEEKEVIDKCKDILGRTEEHEKREVKRLENEIKKLKKKSRVHEENGLNVNAELQDLNWMLKNRPILSSKLLMKDVHAKSKNVQEADSAHLAIVPVSSKEELHGMIPLKEEIKRVAKEKDLFPSVGRDLPESWVRLEEAIKKFRQEIAPPQVPCMTLEEFQKFAFDKAGLSGIQVSSALTYLDSVGEVKFYDKITDSGYSVFLDLQWLCRIVKLLFRHDILEGAGLEYQEDYEVYDMEDIKFHQHVYALRNNGILSVTLLRCIWMELTLNEEEFQKLIKALICFGLACKLKSSQPDDEKLLIPWFLHSEIDPPKKEKLFPSLPNSNVTEYKLRYSISGYLPAGLFDRLCVHSYALGVDISIWKNSMLIYIGPDIKIFLEVDNYITVTGRTKSESSENLWIALLKIVQELESLLKEWPRLVWNTYTVCPHCVLKKASDPHHFECKWLKGQGPRSFRCSNSMRKVIARELLVPSEEILSRFRESITPMPAENVPDSLIRKLSGSLAIEWRAVATFLGLAEHEIWVIGENESRFEEKACTMLQKWKMKKGSGATRSILIKALKEVERKDLVDTVRQYREGELEIQE